jgi:endonuclease/exonuclease/phosphatase family metal-dependent hydrolase
VFTGTDCNRLYFEQYAGTEPPARLDHVLLRDPERRVRVVGAGLTLTERHALGAAGGAVELSDHYGVRATLRVAR